MSAPRLRAHSVSVVHDSARLAAEEAGDELTAELGAPNLVLTFFAAELDANEVLAGLRRKLPNAEIVGCSSYTEVGQDGALTGSVSALGLQLSGVEFKAFAEPSDDITPEELGRRIAESVKSVDPELLIVFPDILKVNATRMLQGIRSVLGDHIPVIGGAPADAGTFTKTFQIGCGKVLSGGVSGVALKGGIRVVTAARSGYEAVGVPRRCTRVEQGNTIVELDGRPALSEYRDFLGERAVEIPAVSIEYPLGVVAAFESSETYPPLVRAVFKIDEEKQTLILGGDIPTGAEIRVLRATRNDIVDGAEAATREACTKMPDPDLALIFNCMSRKVVMGPRYREECEKALRHIPASVPRIGFYTFGEISPFAGNAAHHESTFTLALLRFGT